MIGPFLNYFSGVINGVFNLMGNLTVIDTGITVLAVCMAGIFISFSFSLIER